MLDRLGISLSAIVLIFVVVASTPTPTAGHCLDVSGGCGPGPVVPAEVVEA